MVSTSIPIYFNYLAENAGISSVDYLASWGYAASAATLFVAISGPVLGTLADHKGYKRKLFLAALLVGVICCVLLGFVTNWLFFLVLFVITRVGYSCLVCTSTGLSSAGRPSSTCLAFSESSFSS